MEYVCQKATKKDIDIITSIKIVTMIDEVMDKKLSHSERTKIEEAIKSDIKDNYDKYSILYVNRIRAGVFVTVPYKNGIMIDEIYIFDGYRDKGIATSIIESVIKDNYFTYIWLYSNNKDFLRLLKKIGFVKMDEKNRIIIMGISDVGPKILEQMKDIKIGYVDRKGNYYHNCNNDFKEVYYLQKPQDLLNTKIGLCFDQVELERFLLSKYGFNLRTYYLLYQDGPLGPAHAFLLYKSNDRYYWIENAWYKYKGIHEYETKDLAFLDISKKFAQTIVNCKKDKLKLYEYDKPRSGSNYERFSVNAFNGRIVKLFRS